MEIFDKVNEIWSQADIYFSIKEIVIENISYNNFQDTLVNLELIIRYTEFNSDYINAYFMKNVGGPNGIALSRYNSIFVADKTTVNDFRATSHEFGHILGLHHVFPANNLMAQGKNGTQLSSSQIKVARNNAKNFKF